MAVLVLFSWAHGSDLIPTQRELDSLYHELGLLERAAVIVMAGAGIVIGLGFLFFGRT